MNNSTPIIDSRIMMPVGEFVLPHVFRMSNRGQGQFRGYPLFPKTDGPSFDNILAETVKFDRDACRTFLDSRTVTREELAAWIAKNSSELTAATAAKYTSIVVGNGDPNGEAGKVSEEAGYYHDVDTRTSILSAAGLPLGVRINAADWLNDTDDGHDSNPTPTIGSRIPFRVGEFDLCHVLRMVERAKGRFNGYPLFPDTEKPSYDNILAQTVEFDRVKCREFLEPGTRTAKELGEWIVANSSNLNAASAAGYNAAVVGKGDPEGTAGDVSEARGYYHTDDARTGILTPTGLSLTIFIRSAEWLNAVDDVYSGNAELLG